MVRASLSAMRPLPGAPARFRLAGAPVLLSLPVLFALAGPAAAQEAGAMYKCRTPSGSWLFSDTPCEHQGARQTNRPDYGPDAAPLAPPSADELAARAREMAARTPAENAAIAAAGRARTDAALPKRRNVPASAPSPAPAAAQAAPLRNDPNDPEGLVNQPLVTYRAPAIEAIGRTLESGGEHIDHAARRAREVVGH